jgi:hypothetical protein
MMLIKAVLGPSPKDKIKRKDLMKRARKALPPVLAELGFVDGRRASRKGESRDSLYWPFYRRRDEFWEEMGIAWDPRGNPWFSIRFWTEQTERMDPQPGDHTFPGFGTVLAGPDTRFERWIRRIPFWYGRGLSFEGRSVEALIADACAKFVVLDGYLTTGEPRDAVRIDQRAVTKDGEAFRSHPEDVAEMEEAYARSASGKKAGSAKQT